MLLDRRIPTIVIMAAQTAAIAMAAFMKRIYGFPPPCPTDSPFVQFCLAGIVPAGTTVL
jgi:hypothetical protein